MGDVVSEDGEGNITVKYKPSGDGCDYDDPIGMALAVHRNDGIEICVGMCVARITGENPRGVKAPYSTVFVSRMGRGG